jgi:lysozyme
MGSNWVLGVDTSHWSGKINFPKMYQAGARFWITKATDANRTTGLQFEDSEFDNYCKAAFDLGELLTGCYHWLQYSVDPKVAAQFYLERYTRYKFDFPPILDFEEPSVRDTGRFSDYAWRASEWCKEVERVTGRKPIIYTAQWFTNYFQTSHLSWMQAYPLWIANYSWWANDIAKVPVNYPKLKFEDRVWDDWAIWQYSADTNGRGAEFGVQAKSIDLNWFQGSYADLLHWLKVDEPAPEPLTLEERVERLELAVFG